MFAMVGCNFLGNDVTETSEVDYENYDNISTIEDLKNMSMYQSYQLVNDIDLQGQEWTPIGSFESPFRGHFNGNGYTISNFTITESHTGYYGLFGYLEGDVEELNIRDFTIDIEDNFMISVGGLAGVSYGSIVNVSVEGDILVQSDAGNVYVGLLTGQALSNLQTVIKAGEFVPNEIYDNRVSGSINLNSTQIDYVGGLVGKTHNVRVYNNLIHPVSIQAQTYNTTYIGGVIGHQFLYDFETIDDSLSIDKTLIYQNIVHLSVIADLEDHMILGGIVGYNQNTIVSDNFAFLMYDVKANQMDIGLVLGENWLGHASNNLTHLQTVLSPLNADDIQTICGLNQTQEATFSGFYSNATMLDLGDEAELIAESALLDDEFYQSNYDHLDSDFIRSVQTFYSSSLE